MCTVQDKKNDLDDATLCQKVIEGDSIAEEELVNRYTRLVRIFARPLFLSGGDSEDLIQEGMLGLLQAIRSYQSGRDASFHTYAGICIRHRLYSAIKAAKRGKHAPLNDYIPFEPPLFDGTSTNLISSEESPEDMVIYQEELNERLTSLNKILSGFEAEILPHYLDGLTCFEISKRVSRSPKAVDNAVQRIRRKVAQR